MSFKKLIPLITDRLEQLNYSEPTAFQTASISKIKSGADCFGIAAEDSGKTTALIISIVQKLKGQAKGDNPRAIVIVENKAAALALKADFELFTKASDLRVDTIYEEQNINHQKDDIYYGTDIVIATPKRLSKLYFLNGINLGELMILAVDDAEFLVRTTAHTEIIRISESLSKCQHIILATKFNNKMRLIQDAVMPRAFEINA